jgi:haloalkane dehalogenase
MSPEDPASNANKAAWKVLEKWRKPFITCFSSGDPITRGGDRHMQRRIPGALVQPHITLLGGHFLQEDCPEDFARIIIDALKAEMAA